MRPARGTIAFLTCDYTDYSAALAQAIAEIAHAAGYGLLCVTGRELAARADAADVEDGSGGAGREAVCNGIYRLVERTNVAGLIVESGTLAQRGGPEALLRFRERYEQPYVSLGLDVADTSSVVVEDTAGMIALMEHLLADPGRQRIAFLRGIPSDIYSIERERIFRQMLSEHGRCVDESLFLTGNYDMFDAYNVVGELLRGPTSIDAIVAANDTMALSAARAVSAAGLCIPLDIAISGFDDVSDATRCSPALTTVRQPLTEIAEKGIARLLELIGDTSTGGRIGEPSQARLMKVRSELIIRGSTAGASESDQNVQSGSVASLHGALERGMSGLRTPDRMDLAALAAALAETLANDTSQLADHLSRQSQKIGRGNTHWWSNLCHQIEMISRRYAEGSGQGTRMPWIEAALAPVRERIWSSEMNREFAARRLEGMRAEMQLQIGSATGLTDILDAMDRWMLAFKLRRFFLVRYDKPGKQPRAQGRLMRAVRHGVIEACEDLPLATRDILPRQFAHELGEGTLLLNPVYAGTDHYGYLLIDPDGLELSQVDAAAQCIGNALRSRHLIDALESQASRLRDANQELSAQANQDALTGLANRLCFERYLFDNCLRGDAFALCFIDLDGFKAVNDTLGHEVGDALLRSAAGRLQRAVREVVGEGSFVARLGGDEFTAVIESPSLAKDLQRLLPVLLTALSAPFDIAGQSVSISASIGGAIYPDHGRDASTLLKCADTAMYEAKRLGKNRFVLYRNEGACDPALVGSPLNDGSLDQTGPVADDDGWHTRYATRRRRA